MKLSKMDKKEIDRIGKVLQEYSDSKYKTEQQEIYIKALESKIKAIDDMLDSGIVNGIEMARLIIERIESAFVVFNKKNVYNEYKKRLEEYAPEYKRRIAECESNFEEVLEKAIKIAPKYAQLQLGIMAYKNDENDEKYKMEYYFFLKYHVEQDEILNSKK